MAPPHGVGIIGYGLSAKVFHIPFVQADPSFQLHAIVQRSPKPDDDASKDHPGVKVYASAEEMFNDPKVHVIIVGTPPTTHVPLTKKALESGKHVVVEKPFCATTAECDELIESAKKHSRVLTVYQNRRWDVDYLTLRSLLEKNTFGRIVEFETHFDRWSPTAPTSWKADQGPGHGAVYDTGSHLIDQIIHSFGIPEKVTGFVHPQRAENPTNFEDACTVLFQYSGMLITAKVSMVSPKVKQFRYWIRGDKGSYTKFDEDPQEQQLLSGMSLNDSEFGRQTKDDYGYLYLVDGDKITEQRFPNVEPSTYAAFYSQLAKAIAGEGPPPVPAEDARNVIWLVELARESARTGKTISTS